YPKFGSVNLHRWDFVLNISRFLPFSRVRALCPVAPTPVQNMLNESASRESAPHESADRAHFSAPGGWSITLSIRRVVPNLAATIASAPGTTVSTGVNVSGETTSA